MKSNGGVIVVGSVTADITAFAAQLPRPGQTVIGDDLTLVLGGKGANQAVAAAHFGAPTWMVGCIGDDVFADLTHEALGAHGVRTEWMRRVPGPTGVAHIRVDASGQNDIVITPLANAHLSEELIDAALEALAGDVGVMLLQLEVPVAITAYAAGRARRAGLCTILDPAPAAEVPEEVWADVDIVTPNESEATAITGIEVVDHESAIAAASWFLDRGVGQAIVTLGGNGAVSVERAGRTTFEPFAVVAVDTTAAGDAFTGTLGAATASGWPAADAVQLAMAAGALAVTARGASPSLPHRADVIRLANPTTGGAPRHLCCG